MGTWHLIETLTDGVATVVASGNQAKALTSLRRSVSPAPDFCVGTDPR